MKVGKIIAALFAAAVAAIVSFAGAASADDLAPSQGATPAAVYSLNDTNWGG